MSKTISRQTVTDDNGTGTTGTILDAAFYSTLCDRIDALVAKMPYVLHSANGSQANSGSSPTDIYSRTVDTNTLPVNGYELDLLYTGQFAANGNTKSIDFKFGGLTYYAYSQAINGGTWIARIRLERNTSTNFRAYITMTTQNGAGTAALHVVNDVTNVVDFTISNTLVITVTGTSSNDILPQIFKCVVVPADAAVS